MLGVRVLAKVTDTDWRGMDPNTQHQLWSKWEFTVLELGRSVSKRELQYNIARWFLLGFGDVGTYNVHRTVVNGCVGWQINLLIEGPPAHDPDYVFQVDKQFDDFVEKGWGPLAVGSVKAKVLAGNKQDGKPGDQMITIPKIHWDKESD